MAECGFWGELGLDPTTYGTKSHKILSWTKWERTNLTWSFFPMRNPPATGQKSAKGGLVCGDEYAEPERTRYNDRLLGVEAMGAYLAINMAALRAGFRLAESESPS